MREFGEFLGKSEEAEEAIRHYEEKLAEAKAKLDGVVREGETVGVYEIWAKNFWVVGELWSRYPQSVFGSRLSAARSRKEQIVNGRAGLDISWNRAGDGRGLYVRDGLRCGRRRGSCQGDFGECHLEIPSGLQNNRIYTLDINQFSAGDLISLEKQLEIQTRLLLGNGGSSDKVSV